MSTQQSGLVPTWRDLKEPHAFVALSFGAGLVPYSPGTAGALVALPMGLAIMQWPVLLQVACVGAALALGVVCAEKFGTRFANHDHPAIVWDETVAMLTILLLLPSAPLPWFSALLAFRFFDIMKPWPISAVDAQLHGGLGVMADDLVAAAPSLAVGLLTAKLF